MGRTSDGSHSHGVALDLLDHAMTSSSTNRPLRSERTRGRLRVYWDVTFRALRWIAQRAHGAYTTFGIFLLAGAVLAVAGTWIFSELAGHVTSGKTQAF